MSQFNLKTLAFIALVALLSTLALCMSNASDTSPNPPFQNYALDYDAPIDAALQSKLEAIDKELRAKYEMTTEQTAVGLLDLKHLHLAMIHPDREEYAASVAK